MLGHSHALSGFAVGAATLPAVPTTGATEAAAWVAAVGGCAMLPDLDTGGISTRKVLPRLHGSTVAQTWGPVTCLAAEGVSRVAGGHRKGTHSVLGVAVLTVLAFAASWWFWTSLAVLALVIGIALRSLAFAIPGRVEETWITNLAVSWAAAWWLLTAGDGSPAWLPAAVALGAAVHIAGDALTVGGVPLAWPLHDTRQTFGLFKTGAGIERYVLAPVFLGVAVWLLWQHTGPLDPSLPDVPSLPALPLPDVPDLPDLNLEGAPTR